MEIYLVNAETFKLDGGACFGVVPKSIWSKFVEPDENNMLSCTLRNLLVKDENRLILFDTGIGNKQSEKFRGNFFVDGINNLSLSVNSVGFTPEQITDVVFTHLHFDHCGGAFRLNKNGETEAVFNNAKYWCSLNQWDWAHHANPREKASYLPENLLPILNSGKLNFIEKETNLTPSIFLKLVNGHTNGQIIPHISYYDKILVYMADFIPTVAHIAMPYIASFDIQPLVTMEEKKVFLSEALVNNYVLIFQHDAQYEACSLQNTEKGIKVKEMGLLKNFIN